MTSSISTYRPPAAVINSNSAQVTSSQLSANDAKAGKSIKLPQSAAAQVGTDIQTGNAQSTPPTDGLPKPLITAQRVAGKSNAPKKIDSTQVPPFPPNGFNPQKKGDDQITMEQNTLQGIGEPYPVRSRVDWNTPVNGVKPSITSAPSKNIFSRQLENAHTLAVKPLNAAEVKYYEQLKINIVKAQTELDPKEKKLASIPRKDLLRAPERIPLALEVVRGRNKIFAMKENFYKLFGRVRLQADVKFNGAVSRVSYDPRVNRKPEVIAVYGINQDISRQSDLALETSKKLGANVRMVTNLSDPVVGGGIIRKWAQTLEGAGNPERLQTEKIVKHLMANPQAALAVANLVYDRLDLRSGSGIKRNTEQIKMVAYSQGGAITAAGLQMVAAQLKAKVAAKQVDSAVATEQLARINVLGVASAAAHRHFPEGVKVMIMHDKEDFVAVGVNYKGPTNLVGAATLFGATFKKLTGTNHAEHSSYWENGATQKPALKADGWPTGQSAYNKKAANVMNLFARQGAVHDFAEIDHKTSNALDYKNDAYRPKKPFVDVYQ